MIESPIKVLWLSNRLFSKESVKQSGTWLLALGPDLIKSGEVELGNISFGAANGIEAADFENIKQWKIPHLGLKPGELPSDSILNSLLEVIDTFQPDIIQIWGVEHFWGLLLERGLLKYPCIINIQGIMKTISSAYSGGLNFGEKLKCWGIREFVYPRDSIFGQEYYFGKMALAEKKILTSAKFITVQSEWAEAHVRAISPKATYFRTERALRSEFYNATPWSPKSSEKAIDASPVIFTSSFGNPYKGFHHTLRALRLLKDEFPSITLRVAGGNQTRSWKNTGYNRFIWRLVDKLELESNLVWLDSLDANGLIDELQKADCFVHSSFVESYSLAVAEALAIGTPTVCSFAGALPEMNGNPVNMLFYPPGDDVRMASLIRELVLDKEMARSFSERSRAFIFARCERVSLVKQQILQYRRVLERE